MFSSPPPPPQGSPLVLTGSQKGGIFSAWGGAFPRRDGSSEEHSELYDKLLLREAESRGELRVPGGGGSCAQCFGRSTRGLQSCTAGHHDSRSETTQRLTGRLLYFQVPPHQTLRGDPCAHKVKCVIGKECGHHNGFVTRNTPQRSPNSSQCPSKLPCHWSLALWEWTSVGLGMQRAAQSGKKETGSTSWGCALCSTPAPALGGHRAKGLE